MVLRKWIKWSLIALVATLLLLTLSIGLLVRLRTVYAAKQLVETLSDGKYALKAGKIRVDPFNMRATARNIYIYPLHTGNDNSEFELKADSVSLELAEIFQLLFFNKLNVNSFTIINPSLELRVYEKADRSKRIPIPLHRQVAKIQNVFFEVLESLKVKHFQLVKGSIIYYPELNVSEERYALNKIYLSVDNLHLLEKFTSGKQQNKAAIHLELINPTIEYPDSTIKISLTHFDWDTRRKHFDVTGLGFHKSVMAKGDSTGFQLQNIELDSMNWNKLLNQGVVELGELSASKGYFLSNDLKLRKRNKDSLKLEKNPSLLDVIGPIYIRRLTINEIEFIGNTQTPKGKETINIKGDQFTVNGLVIDKALPNKVQLADLNMKIKAFIETDSSKTFRSGFDEISIENNNLHIKDYYLQALSGSRFGETKVDVTELQLTDLSIADLLNGKLKARELVLIDPTVKIFIPSGKKNAGANGWQKLQRNINKKLDIGFIRINNAHVLVKQENNPKPLVKTDSFYAIIASRNILQSESLEQLFASDNSFTMPKLAIRLPAMEIDLLNAVYSKNNLTAANAKGSTKDGGLSFNFNRVRAQDLNMANIVNQKDSGLLRVLSVGSGELFLRLPDEKAGVAQKKSSQLVRSIYGGAVKFTIVAKDWELSTTMDSIQVELLRKDATGWVWNDYLLKGHQLIFRHPEATATLGSFNFGNRVANSITDTHLDAILSSVKVNANLPKINIIQQIQSVTNILGNIKSIALVDPVLVAVIQKTAEEKTGAAKARKIEFPAIQFINPSIKLSKEKADSLMEIAQVTGGEATIDASSFEPGLLNIGGLKMNLKNISSNQEKYQLRIPALKLQTGKIQLAKEKPLQTVIEELNLQQADFLWQDSSKQIILTGINTSLNKSFRFNTSADSVKRLLSTLPHLNLSTNSLFYQQAARQLVAHQLKVNSDKKQISFDSLHWVGTISRDSFFKAAKVQKDFVQMHMGAGLLNGYEMLERDGDTAWSINQFNLTNLNALLERDKRIPADTIAFRPLMTGMFQELPVKFALERMVLTNAQVRYNEITEKTGKEGSIWFTDLNAIVKNMRNFDLNSTDSLSVSARAKLMGKGNIRLTFRESYTDSLRGFIMLAKMGKMELNALSPLLFPLFNIKIDRGRVDSLWLNVKANDYLAFGKMEMNYRHLKLSLLNEQGKKKGFTSFLINTLLRSNNDKTGLVYRERMRNKSMFNFWGKIAMSGLLTNMGIQKNKKQVKKYNREMKNLNLPEDLLLLD
jgi:hypothetical protein